MTAPFPYRGDSYPGEPLPSEQGQAAEAVVRCAASLGVDVQPWQRTVLGAVIRRGYVAPPITLPRRSLSHP